MRKLDDDYSISIKDLTQEKIIDLEEDLTTILEAHIDFIEFESLFNHIIIFITKTLYNTAPNHKEAYRILHNAINQGIESHTSKHIGI